MPRDVRTHDDTVDFSEVILPTLRRNISSRYLLLLLSLLLASPVMAQTSGGALAGIVLDQSGAAIQGATVVAKNESTGVQFTTNTGPDGGFRFPALGIGTYDVTASQTGFTTQTQAGVNVQIASTATVKLTLQVGATGTEVTVQASPTHIETESSDVGTVITSKQEVELPLALGGVGALRSPEAFVFLAPGTSGPGTANSNNGIFISKIGGGQSFGNDVLLDGTSILRTENGSSFDEAAPSVEAISEFRVITSTFPAQYGRTTGGIEVFGIKSGTNEFHGTAYDILQNDDLNANSWFNNAFGASRQLDKKNDYGGNLGGPVIIPKFYNGKDKTFFFFNWEQYNQHIGGTIDSIVPTAAERGGDFSALLTSNLLGTCGGPGGQPIFSGEIFDPTTTYKAANGDVCRKPFPNNVIPPSMISAVAKNFLGYLPAPNTSLANGDNYQLTSSSPLQNTTYTLRIDENLTEKSKFFATYDTRENARYTSGSQTFPGPADSNGWNQNFVTHYGRFGWSYVFSPTMLNDLHLGYNRTNSQNYTTGAVEALSGNFNWAAKLGIAGISGTEFPIVNMGEGVPAIGRANNDDNVDNGERLNDTITWVKGQPQPYDGIRFPQSAICNVCQ